jgi:hypothetical protein
MEQKLSAQGMRAWALRAQQRPWAWAVGWAQTVLQQMVLRQMVLKQKVLARPLRGGFVGSPVFVVRLDATRASARSRAGAPLVVKVQKVSEMVLLP